MKKTSLLRYLKPYRKYFVIACIAIVIECGLEISIPFLMNQLLDNGMTPSINEEGNITSYTLNLSYTLGMGGVMVSFAIIAFLLGIITAKFTAKAGRGFGYELRKAEYEKIQEFSFKNMDEFRLNSLVTRMTNDVQIVSDTFCQSLRPTTANLFLHLCHHHVQRFINCLWHHCPFVSYSVIHNSSDFKALIHQGSGCFR